MILHTEAEARAWLERLPEWDALAAERLERLAALLAEENARQNLVSAASLVRSGGGTSLIRRSC